MAGVPGELLAHEFVDFSTTRNWALRVKIGTICFSCWVHGSKTSCACLLARSDCFV